MNQTLTHTFLPSFCSPYTFTYKSKTKIFCTGTTADIKTKSKQYCYQCSWCQLWNILLHQCIENTKQRGLLVQNQNDKFKNILTKTFLKLCFVFCVLCCVYCLSHRIIIATICHLLPIKSNCPTCDSNVN